MEAHRRRFLIWRLLSVASAAGAGLAGCRLERVSPPRFDAGAPEEAPPRRADTTPPGMMPSTVAAPAVRPIRVLIVENAPQFRVSLEGPYVVVDERGAVLRRGSDLPWTIIRASADLSLGNQRLGVSTARVITERSAALLLSAPLDDGSWSPQRRYDGALTVAVSDSRKLDAINVVDLDSYLTGVVPGECYPDWHYETYRAQAIAARTYALYEMARTADDDFDVRATVASQVYLGVPAGESGRRAAAAVQSTRGIVCTWTTPEGERIFPAFFSSCCGGMTQDAANCKPIRSVPPLAGGVPCEYCRIAPGEVYRWKPLRLPKAEITTRIVQRYPVMSALGRVEDVQVLSQTSFGRNVRLRLVGSTGSAFDIQAEDFRLAVGAARMRSTDCRFAHDRDAIIFSEGRGFGHGMGLCQWGAQGQALQGRSAAEILQCYYPGSNFTRVY
jgi:stage II sporulation protein D